MKELNTYLAHPVALYNNADTQKTQIISENKARSGIYLWINLVDQKAYIGSSKDLGRRLRDYFNINYLEGNNTMYICRALLHHGYSNFSLEILEYCEVSVLLQREKWYFGLISPEYNLAKEPGSPMSGRTHSEETLAKMSAAHIGSKKSQDTKLKMSAAQLGSKKSEESKLKNALSSRTSIKIEVTDLETNISTIYNSLNQASKALKCSHMVISQYFSRKQNVPYLGRYNFRKLQ